MRILGIDPGTQITGYGCVDQQPGHLQPTLVEAGVLRFKSKDPLEKRLLELEQSLTEILESLKPDAMAIEKLYSHYQHPQTAIIMGHARGVMMLCAQRVGIPIEHLPANEVKKAVTGHGHADKQQMQLAIQTQFRLPEPPSPPDVADALGIALCYARRVSIDQLDGRG